MTTKSKQQEKEINMSSHTEAPASLNFRAYTKKGWQLLVTLRDKNEADLLERFKVTVGVLTEMEVTPFPATTAKVPIVADCAPYVPAQSASSSSPWSSSPQASAPALEDFTFNASILRVAVEGGRKRFKVLGEQFSQWGIVIYDEVLQASGYNIEELEAKDYDITGTVAVVTHDNKQRKKVKELRRE
jgi:hypothetical protein